MVASVSLLVGCEADNLYPSTQRCFSATRLWSSEIPKLCVARRQHHYLIKDALGGDVCCRCTVSCISLP